MFPAAMRLVELWRFAPCEGKLPSLQGNHFERRLERGRPALELGTRTRVGLRGLEMFHASLATAARGLTRAGAWSEVDQLG